MGGQSFRIAVTNVPRGLRIMGRVTRNAHLQIRPGRAQPAVTVRPALRRREAATKGRQRASRLKQRFVYIDRTKGLAILLVVVGHLIARRPPPGPGIEWYVLTKEAIYAFHMPLFVTVSGLVYGLNWRPAATILGDLADARRRAMRLLPAYLLAGLAVFIGKLVFQSFTPAVDNQVGDGATELLTLVLQPTASFCAFLWYIYALVILYLAFPPAFRAVRGRLAWLLPVTIGFWWLPSSEWFAWNLLKDLCLFFVIGVIAGRHHEITLRWLERLWLPALPAFVALLPGGALDEEAARWGAAALSIVALPGLMRATESWKLGVFEMMGRYTLIIYLTNTVFIGLVKVASFQLGLWHAAHFPAIAVVMTLVAIGGAIALKRHLLPLVPTLDRITT
jgi:fucose 4-O-acetylase-like acetyltransferase